MVRKIKRSEISVAYFFCIYEKDSNFISLALSKNKIHSYKISSEVPLAVWNRRIVADKLCLCLFYQFEELDHFRDSVFYNQLLLWGPERSHIVKPIYDRSPEILKELKLNESNIGFYSTGGWIRKKLGHLEQGLNFIDNETIVLEVLMKYCLENKKKLLVFLHPREKKSEFLAETKQHYKQLLNRVDYDFANLDEPTSALFHKVNVAVAYTSTIVFERVYFGFKTLILPLGFKDFPLQGTGFSRISASSHDDLLAKATLAMTQSTAEFFEANELKKYTNYNWN
ncbi:MAG: hypothetical protein M3R27_13885 [Bacteroidota bacterium]|nr:hypothetical protein [Bacteroidota bacterium]